MTIIWAQSFEGTLLLFIFPSSSCYQLLLNFYMILGCQTYSDQTTQTWKGDWTKNKLKCHRALLFFPQFKWFVSINTPFLKAFG